MAFNYYRKEESVMESSAAMQQMAPIVWKSMSNAYVKRSYKQADMDIRNLRS